MADIEHGLTEEFMLVFGEITAWHTHIREKIQSTVERTLELAKPVPHDRDQLKNVSLALLHGLQEAKDEHEKFNQLFPRFIESLLDELRLDQEEHAAVARRNLGKLAANIRLSKDPKQAAKAEAKALWLERYAGKHPKLRTNEHFAAEVIRRWPILPSSKVICGWCTQWKKEAQATKNPAS